MRLERVEAELVDVHTGRPDQQRRDAAPHTRRDFAKMAEEKKVDRGGKVSFAFTK